MNHSSEDPHDNRLKRALLPEDKRNMFSQTLRQQHRQQLINSMRQQVHHNMPLNHRDPFYDSQRMMWLHQGWQESLNSPNAAQNAQKGFIYILEGQGRIMQREAIGFLKDWSGHLHRLITGQDEGNLGENQAHIFCQDASQCGCDCSGCSLQIIMQRVVKQIQTIFRLEGKARGGNSEGGKIDKCYYELVDCCSLLPCYLPVWEAICTIDHPDLINYSLAAFRNFVAHSLFQQDCSARTHQANSAEISKIEEAMIDSVLLILRHYSMMLAQDPLAYEQGLYLCIDVVGQLLQLFILEGRHLHQTILLLVLLLDIASRELQPRIIKKIGVKTEIYKCICHATFQRKDLRSQEIGILLVADAALLAGRLFSTSSEQLCNEVYMANILIMKHLRTWLPLPPSSSALQPVSLTHQNHECTRNIIYCLSNIAATNVHYIELFASTDIFVSLLHLYRFVPISTRTEIAHTLNNIFYLANSKLLGTLLHQAKLALVETLKEMLEQKNPTVLCLTMDIITFICEGLPPKDQDNANGVKFSTQLHKEGCLSLLESHLSSKAEGVSDGANKTLKVVEDLLHSSQSYCP